MERFAGNTYKFSISIIYDAYLCDVRILMRGRISFDRMLIYKYIYQYITIIVWSDQLFATNQGHLPPLAHP